MRSKCDSRNQERDLVCILSCCVSAQNDGHLCEVNHELFNIIWHWTSLIHTLHSVVVLLFKAPAIDLGILAPGMDIQIVVQSK